MPINQITAANTFQHWLVATQQLITKYNALESDLVSVSNTANSVLIIKNDTANIYSNTVLVYNSTNSVYQNVVSYTSTAYDIANSAIELASIAYDSANSAYDIAIDAYNTSSNAFVTANIAYNTSLQANAVATNVLANTANIAHQEANNIITNIIVPIFDIDDVNSDNDTYYPLLTGNSAFLDKTIVSTGKLKYIPATGNLTSTFVNATNQLAINGQAVANSSGWIGPTIPITKGGTGATTAVNARINLGVQASSSYLTDISALIPSANNFMVGDGSTWKSINTDLVKSALGFNLGTTANRLAVTTTNGLQSLASGTSGYYLKSGGTGLPSWAEAPGIPNTILPLGYYSGNNSIYIDPSQTIANRFYSNKTITITGGGISGSVATDFSTNPTITVTLDPTGHTHTAVPLANSAVKLQTSRNINGVLFDGTSDITVKATATYGLNFGTYLTGTSYNGSSAVTLGTNATNLNTGSTLVARDGSGNFSAGTITATLSGSSSSCSGNAATATKLQTARTLTIGNTGKTFDGSGNVSWNTSEIGVVSLITIGGGDQLVLGSGFVLKAPNSYSPQFNAWNYRSDTTGYPYCRLGKARGTIASPTAVIDGDPLGVLDFDGYQNGDFRQAAVITGRVDGSPSGNYVPGKLMISIGDGTGGIWDTLTCYKSGLIRANYCLGVGNITAAGATGEIQATNNITAYYSDERLKDFHGTISDALDKVLSLNGYYFTENQTAKDLGYSNDRMQVGLSAQEVEKVFPEIITNAPIDNDQNYKTMWYEKMAPLFVEAIKEQQKIIENQEERIKKLENLIEQMVQKQ